MVWPKMIILSGFYCTLVEVTSHEGIRTCDISLKQILSHFLCLTIKTTTATAAATTTTTADVSKRNWSSLGVRGSWGKRSNLPSSHYILFSHDDFNSKSRTVSYAQNTYRGCYIIIVN